MASLTVGIRIADTTEIHLTDTMLDERVYRLLYLIVVDLPETCEIIHDTIRYHTQGDTLPHFFLLHHQTVHCIVQCRVTAHDDNGFIAIVYHHLHQAFHTLGGLTLHKVVGDATCIQLLLDLLPALTFVGNTSLRAINNAPFCHFYSHSSFILSIFSSIGSVASIQ